MLNSSRKKVAIAIKLFKKGDSKYGLVWVSSHKKGGKNVRKIQEEIRK